MLDIMLNYFFEPLIDLMLFVCGFTILCFLGMWSIPLLYFLREKIGKKELKKRWEQERIGEKGNLDEATSHMAKKELLP